MGSQRRPNSSRDAAAGETGAKSSFKPIGLHSVIGGGTVLGRRCACLPARVRATGPAACAPVFAFQLGHSLKCLFIRRARSAALSAPAELSNDPPAIQLSGPRPSRPIKVCAREFAPGALTCWPFRQIAGRQHLTILLAARALSLSLSPLANKAAGATRRHRFWSDASLGERERERERDWNTTQLGSASKFRAVVALFALFSSPPLPLALCPPASCSLLLFLLSFSSKSESDCEPKSVNKSARKLARRAH